jgi:hypothetical protein
MTLKDVPIVVTPLGIAVRARDGLVLAKEIADDLGGEEYGVSPVASGDIVYLGDRYTSAVRLELSGDRLLTKKLWSAKLPNATDASPIVWSGLYFYAGKSAEYSVLDAATGTVVLERPRARRTRSTPTPTCAPVCPWPMGSCSSATTRVRPSSSRRPASSGRSPATVFRKDPARLRRSRDPR